MTSSFLLNLRSFVFFVCFILVTMTMSKGHITPFFTYLVKLFVRKKQTLEEVLGLQTYRGPFVYKRSSILYRQSDAPLENSH